MKHINLSENWEWGTSPFPGYRAELVFGRNKRANGLLPVKDVQPIEDPDTGRFVLPENAFKVIKTKAKGTILVVPGSDNTNRALVFIDAAGDFRGGISIEDDTATILKDVYAGNNTESARAIIALFRPGEVLVVHEYGRYRSDYIKYKWDGSELSQSKFSKAEWEAANVNYDTEIEEL